MIAKESNNGSIRDKVKKRAFNLKKDYKEKVQEDFEITQPLRNNIYKLNLMNRKEDLMELSDSLYTNIDIKIESRNIGDNPLLIGNNGIIFFFTYYNDNKNQIFIPEDIEEKTSFSSNFIDNKNNSHNVTCRLFRPRDENIRIFCNIMENGEEYGNIINYFENCSFIYDNYKINIFSGDLNIKIFKIDLCPLPFLYSDKQIIYINSSNTEQKASLRFNFDSYNNETLFIAGRTVDVKVLNDCYIESKELICKIKQEILENMLAVNNDILTLMYSNELIRPYPFSNVLDIIVNIIDYEKQNIYVKITKLLETYYEEDNYITYETNVTNISNIKSIKFDIYRESDFQCHFKKYSQTPLLLLCQNNRNGNFSLEEIKQELKFDDICAKYNFIILPVINYEQFRIEGLSDADLSFSDIDLLNFNLNDDINITYFKSNGYALKNIRLNPYSNDILLDEKGDNMVRLIINKSHFENQISGYFFTYHLNSLGKYSIYYQFSPLQVILPIDNKIILRIKKENNFSSIKIGKKGILYFTTNYNDYQRNVFNINNINDISFNSSIKDDNNNEYEVNCRLWKPINEKIRIFCDLKNNLKYNIQNITLRRVNFDYNDYIIDIIQEEYLEVEQFNYEISFLYSNQYTLYLYDEDEYYVFNFNIEAYYDDILFIYGQANNYAVLDNCKKNNKELICLITKAKFEEILALNKEIFKIGIMNDNIGIYQCDCILDIIVYYEKIKKEDINISLTGEMEKFSEQGAHFGYYTNVTSIPNFISDVYISGFFKKSEGRPLIFYMNWPFENKNYTLNQFLHLTIIKNKHYKYNFIIEPFTSSKGVVIKGQGTDIKLTYPVELDFTKRDSFTIRYIMAVPSYSKKIKLNLDETFLNCENLLEMKKCEVSLRHFIGKKSGKYQTYHYTDNNICLSYIDSPLINVILPENIVVININDYDYNKEIIMGKNGILYFVTNYTDNEMNIFDISDIEEKTEFNNTILDEKNNSYNVICRLWKPLEESIRIFCKLKDDWNIESNYIKLNDIILHYNEYTIIIIQDSDLLIKISYIESALPFLFSDSQIVNIEENINSYEIKFNIFEYNNEPLILFSNENNFYYIILDKCNRVQQKLNCQIPKGKFEEILYNQTQNFYLSYYNENIQNPIFYSVLDIIVNYTIEEKENIYVEITSLKNKASIYKNNYIAYETNSTNISSIHSKMFNVNFEGELLFPCLMKKTDDNPLLLVCLPLNKGNYYLGKMNEEILLDDINVKYNFIIQPFNNTELFKVEKEGSSINFFYPTILDFYSSEKIIIEFYLKGESKSILIKLNPDSTVLECKDIPDENNTIITKKCVVPRSHFVGKKSGYYFIHYLNYENEPVIFYELSPIQVILPPENEIYIRITKENNKNILKIGNKGTFAFITDYNDTEKNIFKNISMIFNNKIIDENKNEYKVECKFWKPSDENIRIFCKLNIDLNNSNQNIILNKYSFDLDDYKIIIIQEDYIEAEFYNYNIPFLYSDKVIKNYKNIIYNLTLSFQVESYFNDLLYIYGQHNNYEILDNCTLNDRTLNCLFTVEKIHELVIYNNETYKIGFVNDKLGLIPFDNILDISLNDTLIDRIELYVGITKLINTNTEIGAYYGYETNITDSRNFITDFMDDIFDSCFMKKSTNKPLLILCKALKEYSGLFIRNLSQEIVYNNIHYFYILRIQHFNVYSNSFIKGYGTDVKLIHPEILDFTKNDILTIRYLMTEPSLAKNIKLLFDSPNLPCINLNGMKKCEISKDYFLGENGAFYDTYHLNHEGNLSIYNEINSIEVILPEEESLCIFVLDKDNNQEINIGQNGIIYFITNYTDNISNIFDSFDIEEKTEFKTKISDNYYNDYDVTCRLWKPYEDYFRIFCKLNENIIKQNIYIKLNSGTFTYDNHKINIIILMDYSIKLNIFNSYMPFIYSDKQTILVNENNDFYEIKFKLLEYNNEQLILFNKEKEEEFSNIFLDNCNLNGKNISCRITRENIEEILGYSGQEFILKYFDNNLGLLFDFNNVFDIIINYPLNKKENIYIGITKLLEKNIGMNDYITYETNITSISNIISNKFIYNKSEETKIPCLMKKTKDKPLLILCKIIYKGELSLGEIKQEIKLVQINIKYNLLIQPKINNEVFTSGGDGASILFASPIILDYYLKDSFTIIFYSNEIKNLRGIKLNPDNNTDLKCTLLNNIKKCIIDKSHFEG